MDYDLVLKVTEEELLEFPEEGPCEGHLESETSGTVVPDCSQNSFKTTQHYKEDTPQKKEVYLSNTATFTEGGRRQTSHKANTNTSSTTLNFHRRTNTERSSAVYATSIRRDVGHRRRSTKAQERQDAQRSARGCRGIAANANTSQPSNDERNHTANGRTGSRKTIARRARRLRSRRLRLLRQPLFKWHP